MHDQLSRRDFLKIGALAFSSLTFRPYFIPGEQPPPDLWGRVTMRLADAKWLFRWSTPVWKVPVKDRSAWDRR